MISRRRNEDNSTALSIAVRLYPIRASKCAADASRPGCSICTSFTIFVRSCLIGSFFWIRELIFNVGLKLGIVKTSPVEASIVRPSLSIVTLTGRSRSSTGNGSKVPKEPRDKFVLKLFRKSTNPFDWRCVLSIPPDVVERRPELGNSALLVAL